MNILVQVDFDSIRIYADGALHLRLKRSQLLGIQSWRCGDNHYSIEYTLKGGTVLTEYDSLPKWLKILELLDQVGVL